MEFLDEIQSKIQINAQLLMYMYISTFFTACELSMLLVVSPGDKAGRSIVSW